jgi:hypothetical protein
MARYDGRLGGLFEADLGVGVDAEELRAGQRCAGACGALFHFG